MFLSHRFCAPLFVFMMVQKKKSVRIMNADQSTSATKGGVFIYHVTLCNDDDNITVIIKYFLN